MQSVDNFSKNILSAAYFVVPAILLFVWWRACERVDKHFNAKCRFEITLHFEGVVSNYKTDIFAEKSTFMLNDTAQITIPRSSKEVGLHDGDTVKKVAGQNVYVVKWKDGWNGIKQEAMRKFEFECPLRD